MPRDNGDIHRPNGQHRGRAHVHGESARHGHLGLKLTVGNQLHFAGHGERLALLGKRWHRQFTTEFHSHGCANPGCRHLVDHIGVIKAEHSDAFELCIQYRT